MNKFISVIMMLLLVFSSAAFAAKKGKQAKKDVFQYSASPFNMEWDELPSKNYLGAHPLAVYFAIKKMPEIEKSQYETQDAFSKRKKEYESLPLYGDLNMNSLIAFGFYPEIRSPKCITSRFNAETSELTFNFHRFEKCELESRELGSRVKIGRNAFGVKKKYISYQEWDVNLSSNLSIGSDFEFAVKIPVTEGALKSEYAEVSAKMTKIFVVGRLQHPYMSDNLSVSEATFSDHEEIVKMETTIFLDLVGYVVSDPSGKIVRKEYVK